MYENIISKKEEADTIHYEFVGKDISYLNLDKYTNSPGGYEAHGR